MIRPSYPIGDIVALMRTRHDADAAAGRLEQLGVATIALDLAEQQTVLIVHHPGRSQIAEIRRILRSHRARRARWYRAQVIEELVRVSGSWLPDLSPRRGSARAGGNP